MTSENNRRCKLCLKVIQDNNYKILDGDTEQVLEVLLLKVNVVSSEHAVICADCSEMLQKCFEFKSSCLCVEDYISPFFEDGTKIDIVQLWQKNKISNKDIKLCRFCMGIIKDDICTHLDGNENQDLMDSIKNCFPELDCSAVNDPLICTECINCLNEYSNFQKKCRRLSNVSETNECRELDMSSDVKCQNIESNRNVVDVQKDCNNSGCNGNEQSASSSCLDEYEKEAKRKCFDDSKNEHLSYNDAQTKNEVNEMNNRAGIDYIKSEEVQLKDESVDVFGLLSAANVGMWAYNCERFNQNASDMCAYNPNSKTSCNMHLLMQKGPLRTHTYKYECAVCIYKTNYKPSFNRHKKVHLDPSEKQMYNCDVCDFSTAYKCAVNNHKLVHKDSSQTYLHKCNVCAFKSKWKSSLLTHQSCHKDPLQIKMYTCFTCGFMTRYRHSLKGHERRHLLPDEKNIYKCDKCDYGTPVKFSLKRHSAVHKKSSE